MLLLLSSFHGCSSREESKHLLLPTFSSYICKSEGNKYTPRLEGMDAKEEAVGAYSSGSSGDVPSPVVVRRTRSKRRRGVGPPMVAASDSSSASGVESGVTDEEEDMANCLILLAQGGGGGAKCVSRRVAEGEATGGGRAGLCVYECKTCNKCFPSFQALGGHRASHKKLEMAASSAEGKQGTVEESGVQISMHSFLSKHPVFAGGKAKIHVCSMCGSEFSSGQALGGHMRRHRPPAATAMIANVGEKKERSMLSLDLNLPAPGDDSGSPFSIAVVSALFPPAPPPALVDCHY